MPSSKPITEKMPKDERKATKDWLKSKGLKQKDLDLIPDDGDESRNDITNILVKFCQKLPKNL